MTGRLFFWLGASLAILMVVFRQGIPEGGLAPIAGMSLGLLFGRTVGKPRVRLANDEEGAETTPRPRPTSATTGEGVAPPPPQKRKAPPLRVVQDDSKNKKPPKDKRFLN